MTKVGSSVCKILAGEGEDVSAINLVQDLHHLMSALREHFEDWEEKGDQAERFTAATLLPGLQQLATLTENKFDVVDGYLLAPTV